MYAFGDEPSRSEAPSRSLADLPSLESTVNSHSFDAGLSIFNQPNILYPSSVDSSLSDAPLTPLFDGGVFVVDSLSTVVETFRQVTPSALQPSSNPYFPDTPAADIPPVDNLNHQHVFSCQNANNEYLMISHLTDGESGQNVVFQFPNVNNSVCSSPLPASVGNALSSISSMGITPSTVTMTQDHVFKDPHPSILDTPPTTPNQNCVLGSQSRKQPRPRLGGVSTFSLAGDDMELDCDLDDLNALTALVDAMESEAAASGTLKRTEEQVRHLDDSNDLDVFCDLDLAESGMTAMSTMIKCEYLMDKDVEGLSSCTEHKSSTVAAKPESGADVDGTSCGGLKESSSSSQNSQNVEPVLKEELRRKIIKRRHDSGMEHLDTTQDPQPQRECQMTELDYARRDTRREQNRGAAKRFREKMKQKHKDTKNKLEEAEEINSRLSGEVEVLRDEVSRLHLEIDRHRDCGDCGLLQAARNVRPVLPDSQTAPLHQHADHIQDVGPGPR